MKSRYIVLFFVLSGLTALATAQTTPTQSSAITGNLFKNPDFEQRNVDGKPLGYELSGDVVYRYLGDPKKVNSSYGISLQSGKRAGAEGFVSQTVGGLDSSQGKWFRFTFRGLPQANFSVDQGDFYMRVEFFGQNGAVSYDKKARRIFDQVVESRKDFTTNGVRHVSGAEVWQNYQLDFMLPFPQVDQLRLSVGFGHGSGKTGAQSEFFVDDFSLIRIPDPPGISDPATRPAPVVPDGNLIALGGRWFYAAKPGESQAPAKFDYTNGDRLLYHDNVYSAPFAGNMVAILKAGDLDAQANKVSKDRFILDNVTVTFDSTSMMIRTHGIPNHPTGRFPVEGFGPDSNPNTITEQIATYYIPLIPKENPNHIVTAKDNSNHALPMGPIGIAVNGVVFFNPFDADSQDAADLMDLCCGHPNPDGQYHYHKYPICVNSPWADDGRDHSPLIGWAFDGYPLYGPYASKDVMAKDVKGDYGLNDFNMHFDSDRGWHYQVTPGKFPYLIGGYWGTEDSRDSMGGPDGGPDGGRGGGRGGRGGRGPRGMGPPSGRDGRGGPPPGPPPY
jgi:hypothetical protein